MPRPLGAVEDEMTPDWPNRSTPSVTIASPATAPSQHPLGPTGLGECARRAPNHSRDALHWLYDFRPYPCGAGGVTRAVARC